MLAAGGPPGPVGNSKWKSRFHIPASPVSSTSGFVPRNCSPSGIVCIYLCERRRGHVVASEGKRNCRGRPVSGRSAASAIGQSLNLELAACLARTVCFLQQRFFSHRQRESRKLFLILMKLEAETLGKQRLEHRLYIRRFGHWRELRGKNIETASEIHAS